MEIVFTHSAFRQLKKLDIKIQKRIIDKLKFFASQKNPLQFAESLKDYRFGHFRFRIGDYRAIFDVEKEKIIILKVSHRKEIYR
jgi:mRNA interferase RelE/StbE